MRSIASTCGSSTALFILIWVECHPRPGLSQDLHLARIHVNCMDSDALGPRIACFARRSTTLIDFSRDHIHPREFGNVDVEACLIRNGVATGFNVASESVRLACRPKAPITARQHLDHRVSCAESGYFLDARFASDPHPDQQTS
jgi:hypothetical protein